MATIQLVNGPQLSKAKVCELCPSKPKIWPESKFYLHLKEAHDPEQSRRCWRCSQVRAGREFRNPTINTCNVCREKQTRAVLKFRKSRKVKRSKFNVGEKVRERIKLKVGKRGSFSFPVSPAGKSRAKSR